MKQSKKFQQAIQLWSTTGLIAGVAALTLSMVACAPGFETKSLSSCLSNSCANDSLGGGTNPTAPGWESVQMDGAINGGRFDQTKVVEIDKSAKALILRLPFIAGFQIGAQIPVQIREIPGATVGIEPNSDGSSSLVLRIPLAHVLKGIDTLPSGRLPNGDALPAIPEGELPSIGLTLSKAGNAKGALYLSPTVVGLFVATKFNPYIALTLPIRNESRTRTFGYFSSVPAKAGFDGGFFISVALPDDLARAIDDLL